MNDAPSSGDWLQIVRGEFLQVPGLRLTRAQIQRLWGLDDAVCRAVLGALVEERFLSLTADGHYARAGSDVSGIPGAHGARSSLD